MAPKDFVVSVPAKFKDSLEVDGSVVVQGVDIKKSIEDLNLKLSKIEEADLKTIKENIDKLFKEFSVTGHTKSYLEKLCSWIEMGKNLKEIIEFIKQVGIELGPILTDVLLKK